MRLVNPLTLLIFISNLLVTDIFSQCVLPSGSYQWGATELNNHITNNCGGAPLDLVIPTDATINITNNDTWDLSSQGAMTLRIQSMGSLVFNGTDELTMASGSTLLIENTSNPEALKESGIGTNIRINIGATTYTGNEFATIIASGGANEAGLLPVELSLFEGEMIGGKDVLLNWVTASEKNNSHFEVEHSTNGEDFYFITRLRGKGNSSIDTYYQYIHSNPPLGQNYYRLKQVDFNDNFEYSSIIIVNVDQVILFKLFANSMSTLNFYLGTDADMLIYDLSGKLVLQEQIKPRFHEYSFDFLPSGNYIVKVVNSTFNQTILISR